MEAKVQDLRKGDTVIVALGSVLAEVKLLREPQIAKTGRKTTWKGTPRWTSILCSLREEKFTGTSQYGRMWTSLVPVIANGKEHTKEKRIDFTEKTAWIIKRERQ